MARDKPISVEIAPGIHLRVRNSSIRRISNRVYIDLGDYVLITTITRPRASTILRGDFARKLADFNAARPADPAVLETLSPKP